MEARGWHRVFPHCPPYLWIKFSHQRGRQTEQPAPGSSCFLPTLWTDYKLRVRRILTWVLRVLCPGPHSYIASLLLTNVVSVYKTCIWVCMMHACAYAWWMHVSVCDACMWMCLMHACECIWCMYMSVWCIHVSAFGTCILVCLVHTCECVWCMHVNVFGACMWVAWWMHVCLVHACECAWCMHVSVQICICTCRGPRKLLNVFLYSLCLIGLEQSLTHQTLTSQRTPSILLSLPPKAGVAAHKSKLGFILVLSIRTQPPAQPYGCHFDLHLTSS